MDPLREQQIRKYLTLRPGEWPTNEPYNCIRDLLEELDSLRKENTELCNRSLPVEWKFNPRKGWSK